MTKGTHTVGPMTWAEVLAKVLEFPARTNLNVDKAVVPHPSTVAVFRPSRGMLIGQARDWRYTLADGRGLHVSEFDTYYLVHWDMRDPGVDLLGHLASDTPRLFMLSALVLGTLTGAATGKLALDDYKTGAITGALVATGLGVLFIGKGSIPQ